MKKSFLMIILSFIVACTAGCQTSDLQEAASRISELEESMQKERDKTAVDEEEIEGADDVDEEPQNYVSYHQNKRGYDVNGKNYAIKQDDESGNAVFSIVGLDELKDRSEPIIYKSFLYREMENQYLTNISNLYQGKDLQSGNSPLSIQELKEAIMIEADLLLCLEYYQEGFAYDRIKEEAERLAYLIYESVDVSNNDLMLKYNSAAILEKIVYVLPELTCSKDANDVAIMLWTEAEKSDDESGKTNINRAWAASEFYRVSGQKTYRTIVEAIKEGNDFNGLTYDNPGYYCAFAYLSSFEKTNYAVCESIMNTFINTANESIKTDFEQFFNDSLQEEKQAAGKYKEEYINGIINECWTVIMANKISISVEYTGLAENRLHFLCGANPTGIDYLSADSQTEYCPVLFILAGMN